MRRLRFFLIATALAALLAVPTTAAAQIDQFSLSRDVQLGPEGAFATAFVTATCTAGFLGDLGVSVTQNTGGSRLASGSGFTSFTCTGERQAFSVPIRFSIFALKNGKATATADLSVANWETGEFDTQTVGPVTVRVHK